MNILLTGANGYIGLRLLPNLLEAGHRVVALVRDRSRFPKSQFQAFLDDGRLTLMEGDMLEPDSLAEPPEGVDAAYYLLHSMGAGQGFEEREAACAENFVRWLAPSSCRRILYLGGLVPDGPLSHHLQSRENVNAILRSSAIPVTTLRASIIVGSGSASFEIIRDLVEKLPFMITPRWTRTRCQPIAIRNVIFYLTRCLEVAETCGREFDVGGPEVISYRDVLRQYASARGLRRYFIPMPLLTPRLSAHWLHFVTATTLPLAKSLIESLRNETICRDHQIEALIPQPLIPYQEAIELAFAIIAQNRVPSSWIDSLASGRLDPDFLRSIRVPEHGVLTDQQRERLGGDRERVIDRVWSLGGSFGWPAMNWAWRIRGWFDVVAGGTGLRRGRRHPTELRVGDALDFWRVVMVDRVSDPKSARLILYAEMKLPGEAWLDFEVTAGELRQTATFRPRGLIGRVYWYAVLPFHFLLFPRMARRLASASGT